MSEDSGVLPSSAEQQPAENSPSPLSLPKKMLNFGQDQHPDPAWMGTWAGRGAAHPPSTPGRREPAV